MEVSGLSSLPIASEMKRTRSDTPNGVGVSTDQLHRQSMPGPTDMEHILAHRAEQVLAGRKGLGRAADDYRQGRGCRAVRAAADRSIEHGGTLGAEAFGKTARGKRVDRAPAQDDVTLFCGLDNPL